MSQEEQTYHLIERYLNSELSPGERENFEARLQQDPSLAQELELHQATNNFILAEAEYHVAQEVKTFFNSKGTKKTKFNRNTLLGLALVALIGGGLSAIYFDKDDHEPILREKSEQESSPVVDDHESLNPSAPQAKVNMRKQDDKAASSHEINQVEEATITNPTKTEPEQVKEVYRKEVTTEQSTSEHKPKTTSPQIDPCDNVTLKLDFTNTPTCTGESEGKIELTIEGGTAPYTFFLDAEKLASSLVTQLYAGDYPFTATDNNGCKTSEETVITVKSKDCFVPEEGFSSEYETWEYQSTEGEIELTITNRTGKQVFNETGETFEWTGQDQNGGLLPADVYLYLTKQNGKVLTKGYVTIVR